MLAPQLAMLLMRLGLGPDLARLRVNPLAAGSSPQHCFASGPKAAQLLYGDGEWEYWGSIAGQFGGGAWSVQDTPDSNVLVSYSDLRLTTGLEGKSFRGYAWSAEIGYVFSRQVSVNYNTLVSPSDSLLLSGSWSF